MDVKCEDAQILSSLQEFKMGIDLELEIEKCLASNGALHVLTESVAGAVIDTCRLGYDALMDCKYCTKVEQIYLCMYKIMQYEWEHLT